MIMTKIKICGIKTVEDALAAMQAGADLLGFNFYSKSPRCIDVGTCRDIMSVMRRYGQITYVGVFVNASVAEIRSTMETCGLSLAQLHGDETAEMVQSLDGKAFKAVRLSADSVTDSRTVTDFAALRRGMAPVLLVDAAVKGAYGGTGVTADWRSAAELANHHPILLAGGLTPENVVQAVQQVNPWGVDVASGVESVPGLKDAHKMNAFVKAVRSATTPVVAMTK